MGLDDDELVLGSGAGSDVTAGVGDSGISLGNPSDSGLSLEEPLELSSGSGVESLELGEDEMLDLDDSMAGGVDADDDFMLTPVEDGLDEESDSGSQVIALDSEDFGESAVEMLTEEDDESGVGDGRIHCGRRGRRRVRWIGANRRTGRIGRRRRRG